ncbi:aldehyde dehydrogenase family protein [Nonomuraea cavernae]|uniref:5-carboxymethyl-2-hydroxymuconate semialdehyde dehydrogenase n=1 Tax=Nonomuraea cavernae TaxID=2045107 RepID=A0A918DR71_9ACTN|nr:aldehyde dehydrogenase family protein [Nonomuraea cavernae]MCA2188864.1 aldehyde dehydrogenase family protein [Nonomuraea cavernae]GGO78472.1 5-carboxymethyl-2-hydroxymuconate semialdehyde dehydrogenase [Nonomuraea cavernae]
MIRLPEPADLVDGGWAACADDLGFDLEAPATGEAASRARGSAAGRIEAALATADRVAASWAATTPEHRAGLLDTAAAALAGRVEEIVALESFATGVPIRQTGPLGVIVHGAFALAAAQLREGLTLRTATREDGRPVEVHRLPWGPALCLTPWNAPAPMAAHKTASALAAGCPVILKVSEYAPYGTQLLAETLAEVLPPGVFQLVQGGAETGARLAADARVRAVSFTGGLAGGRAVAAACATTLRPAQLELGGNNPLLVMPDAETGAAARAAAELLTSLNGQWCRALGRLLVPRARQAELVEAVGERLTALRVGDPLAADTEFGPLVHSAHLRRVRAATEAAGGLATAYGSVPDKGNFLAPTLITGTDLAEEIFGPVAAVVPYDTVDEAVALANGTPYGLEGYVVGGDEERALSVARRIRAGEVKVNGSSVLSLHLFTPRPAWGLSGLGEEGTAETILFFTGARVVGVEGGR